MFISWAFEASFSGFLNLHVYICVKEAYCRLLKKKSPFSVRVNIWGHYKHLCSKGASRAKGADAQADRTFRLIQKQFAYWFSFSAHGSITTPASYSNAPASRKARREAPQPQQGKKDFDCGTDNSPSETETPAAARGCLPPPRLWGTLRQR